MLDTSKVVSCSNPMLTYWAVKTYMQHTPMHPYIFMGAMYCPVCHSDVTNVRIRESDKETVWNCHDACCARR